MDLKDRMNNKEIFLALYQAATESELEEALDTLGFSREPKSWRPYGGTKSNFGVVENQQASPIPALVEKLVNSVDAILMRRCLEAGVDPRSQSAPRSMDEAVKRFFPEASNWDLPTDRKRQAECIQVIADGPRMDTSIVIYDDGEGQHPADFEDTFLSLLRGNKNEIHFVQGKYNMGGAGALAFCGKKRYQLIGSRRFDEKGEFGFTLIRRHPLSSEERDNQKNTWYEYLTFDGRIPSFKIEMLDLGLHNRTFKTGTIIKLYSYDLPKGSRSVISRDLNQSINEYLFCPALPMYTVDTAERYPKDKNLERDLFGLQRRLEEGRSKYLTEMPSQEINDHEMGRLKITTYVFKPRVDGKDAKSTQSTIQNEFFKNNMAVVFSVQGQVHGNYTSEFITRSLKFPLLKNYLLIHVDCTDAKIEFRNELFMASRDRLKAGEESRKLRRKIAKELAKGRLKDICKSRKVSISVENEDATELLADFAKKLPLNENLSRLLGRALKAEGHPGKGSNRSSDSLGKKAPAEKKPFKPQRFPSFLKLEKRADGTPVFRVPRNGERNLKLLTDVEDQYFDRISEPGDLQLTILRPGKNESEGGTGPGMPRDPTELLNVVKSSPHNGVIRLGLNPTADANVGDIIKLRAELLAPGGSFSEIFLVKIIKDKQGQQDVKPSIKKDKPVGGLPELVLVTKDPSPGRATWEELEAQGVDFDHDVIMYPLVEGDLLERVYVNLSSRVLLNHRARLRSAEAIEVAERRYISSVYFHTLFLYITMRNRRYEILQAGKEETGESGKSLAISEFLQAVFEDSYAEFLMNFEVSELVSALEAS